jgi:2-oxoisovalerate dehydrogenase E2 component (dihydrolipoyl transacylase)
MVVAAVMTDKATVEIPSPVTGTVVWLGGEVGDTIAVKAPLLRIKTVEDGGAEVDPELTAESVHPTPSPASSQPVVTARATRDPSAPIAKEGETSPEKPHRGTTGKPGGISPAAAPVGRPEGPVEKPLASPSVRLYAREQGVDLRQVRPSGPAGRILRDDVEQFLAQGASAPSPALKSARMTASEEIKLTGLRRRIAEKMSISVSRIPHITYVEEVDVTALEELRTTMNRDRRPVQPKLTILPFLMRALVKAVAEQPDVNATFDDDAGIITRHAAVHIGIAAQTRSGLVVPVVRHAEARGIWDCASEIARLAQAARTGSATRDELSGSTITISSLGSLGGIVSTPVINHPEVAIVGVNKIAVRPVWDGTQFVPRKMMNLSSSFDHRIVDGWDAATFIQRIRVLLETPALIFIEG